MNDSRPPEPLLRYCARGGFKNLSVAQLGKLVIEFGIRWGEGRNPTLEKDLVPLYVRHWFPDASDEELQAMCESRHSGRVTAQVFQTAFSEEALDTIEAEMGDQEMADVVHDEKQALRLAKKAMFDRSARAPASASVSKRGVQQKESSQSAAASSSAGVAGASVVRPPRPEIPVKAYTVQEAKLMLPAVTCCVLACHADPAWVVKCPRAVAPRSRTRAFTLGNDESSWEALRECLQWAWAAHEEATGAQCPHDFGPPIALGLG